MDYLAILNTFGFTPESLGEQAEKIFCEHLIEIREREESAIVYAVIDARDNPEAPACWVYTQYPSGASGNPAVPVKSMDVAAQFMPSGPAATMALKMAGMFTKGLNRDTITTYIEEQVNNALKYNSLALEKDAAPFEDVSAAVMVYPSKGGVRLQGVRTSWEERSKGSVNSFQAIGDILRIADLMIPKEKALPSGDNN